MRKLTLFIYLVTQIFLVNNSNAQTNTITSFDEFMNLANAKSMTIKSGEIQLTQSKKAKIAAIYGVIDPSGSLSGSYTNNTQLPVNLIPSEILGGQPGTFQEVKFGVQYNTNFNAYAEIKLFNLQGWENLKLAKLNIHLSESNNKLALKNLYENSAIIFFNIATLQEQLKSTKQNLKGAEMLYETTLNKYQAGLVKQQDVNESLVNRKSIEEQVNQIQFLIQQQYIALKLLCDIPEDIQFLIEPKSQETIQNVEVRENNLSLKNAFLNEQISLRNYNKAKFAFTPTLSVFASHLDQQFNTRARPFDNNVNWIPSNYVGLRLSIPLPTAVSIAQSSRSRYDYLLAKNTKEQIQIQAKLNNSQLVIEYNKAVSQKESNREIYQLRKDTYEKNLQNYEAGIISIDQTIRSFNEMISSQYNLISSEKLAEMVLAKININNKIN